MLLEIAIGDAYGLGHEFAPQEFVNKFNDLSQYYPHQKYSKEENGLQPGDYSDDTQMSLSLFEYLMWFKKVTKPEDYTSSMVNPETIATEFIQAFKRDPRKGYAKGFQALLEEVSSGKEFIEKINSKGKTTSNGSVMRACPIGLFGSLPFVKHVAKVQAELTHTGTSILAAQAVALSVYFLFHRLGPLEALPSFLNKELEVDIDWSYDGSRVAYKDDLGLQTAKAAIHTAITTKSFSECLQKAVSYGGDTDSVASVACGIISVSKYHKMDIPQVLLDNLENNQYGKDYLIKLDREFFDNV